MAGRTNRYRRGEKSTDIRVGYLGGKPSIIANWGGRMYGAPLSLDGAGNTLRDSNFGNIRVNGDAVFDSGASVLRVKGDGISIKESNVEIAKFGATTTVKDINLTGKITVTGTDNNISIGDGQTDAGDNNICIGKDAGAALTTDGDENVAIGTSALLTNEDTAFAVAIGFEALKVSVGQSGINNNVAIGYKAGVKINDGLANTIIGAAAGDEMTGADFNVVFGQNAAADLTTGNNNVVLGYLADVSTGAASGQIAIGYSVTCTGNSDITVGASTNTASLNLDGSDTSWAAASSDERFKENITTSVAGLSFINDLRPVTYNWKKKKDVPTDTIYYEEASDEPCLGHSYGNTLHGFIAQEVKTAIDNHPELKEGFKMWKEYDNGVQTIADGNLISVLTKAVQELSAKVEALENA